MNLRKSKTTEFCSLLQKNTKLKKTIEVSEPETLLILEESFDDPAEAEELLEESLPSKEIPVIVEAVKHSRRSKYVPHDCKFSSEAELDKYVRLSNQYSLNCINNNEVNCTLKCGIIDHKMTQKYLVCSCKQKTCNLKYSYTFCSEWNEWNMSKAGEHPLVDDMIEQPKYGIALIVMNLLKEISETNSDLKAKQLLTQITIKRQRNETLTKEIELATINNENYIPTVLPDPKYNFPETLLPPLKKVQSFMNNQKKANINRMQPLSCNQLQPIFNHSPMNASLVSTVSQNNQQQQQQTIDLNMVNSGLFLEMSKTAQLLSNQLLQLHQSLCLNSNKNNTIDYTPVLSKVSSSVSLLNDTVASEARLLTSTTSDTSSSSFNESILKTPKTSRTSAAISKQTHKTPQTSEIPQIKSTNNKKKII